MSDIEKVIADEVAAYQQFKKRWKYRLRDTDPALHEAIVDQNRMFREACDDGDPAEIRLHGEAMIRGWQAANKRMEDEEIRKAKEALPGAKVIAIRPKS